MICHVDADAFFASVLQRRDPRLKGKPLLALGMGGGCVIAASYEAKAFGIKTGMPVFEARKLCPGVLEVQSDFRETGLASEQIETILRRHCPVVQQMSIDEWYLDLATCVGGVPPDCRKWALAIQDEVLWKTDISVSIGIAPSKLLAKMAGEYRKPAGVTVLGTTDVSAEEMLRQRPAAAIPGIGRQRTKVTEKRGWLTAWDIASANPEELRMFFGKGGPELHAELNGTPLSDVTTEEAPPKSVSRARSFKATGERARLWAHILQHLQYVILKMRRQNLAAHGITLWLRDNEFHFRGDGVRLPQLFDTEEQILPYARQCFERTFRKDKRYTQVGFGLWGLLPPGAVQVSLFADPGAHDEREALQKSLDALRDKFGKNVIHRGSAVVAREKKRKIAPIPMAAD